MLTLCKLVVTQCHLQPSPKFTNLRSLLDGDSRRAIQIFNIWHASIYPREICYNLYLFNSSLQYFYNSQILNFLAALTDVQ